MFFGRGETAMSVMLATQLEMSQKLDQIRAVLVCIEVRLRENEPQVVLKPVVGRLLATDWTIGC